MKTSGRSTCRWQNLCDPQPAPGQTQSPLEMAVEEHRTQFAEHADSLDTLGIEPQPPKSDDATEAVSRVLEIVRDILDRSPLADSRRMRCELRGLCLLGGVHDGPDRRQIATDCGVDHSTVTRCLERLSRRYCHGRRLWPNQCTAEHRAKHATQKRKRQ